MRLVDLTHPVYPGMPVWPGDPAVEFRTAATVADNGWNLLELHLGTQSGTHVDAPRHVDDTLPALDELPLERFAGPARVVDLRGLPARSAIGPEHLAAALHDAEAGDVLLLCTGWSAHWGTDRYSTHPWLHPDAAGAAVAAGIRTIGIDAPSVDADDPTLPTHRVLAAAHAVIVENLRGLEQLCGASPVSRSGSTNPNESDTRATTEDDVFSGCWVWLLPLALRGADGSPIRAVAALR